jgi:hypothetical protein
MCSNGVVRQETLADKTPRDKTKPHTHSAGVSGGHFGGFNVLLKVIRCCRYIAMARGRQDRAG